MNANVCTRNQIFVLQKIMKIWIFLAINRCLTKNCVFMRFSQVSDVYVNSTSFSFKTFKNLITWLVCAQQHLDKNKQLTRIRNALNVVLPWLFDLSWISLSFFFQTTKWFIFLAALWRESLKFCFEREELNKNARNFQPNTGSLWDVKKKLRIIILSCTFLWCCVLRHTRLLYLSYLLKCPKVPPLKWRVVLFFGAAVYFTILNGFWTVRSLEEKGYCLLYYTRWF